MNKKAKIRKILREGRLAGGGTEGKAIVMGLLERHGKARVKVVPRRNRAFNFEACHSPPCGTGEHRLHDELRSYRGLIADIRARGH